MAGRKFMIARDVSYHKNMLILRRENDKMTRTILVKQIQIHVVLYMCFVDNFNHLKVTYTDSCFCESTKHACGW